MIRYTLPETLACPEVSLMAGSSANVTATIPWPVLKTHTERERIYICSKSGLEKISFLLVNNAW